ncbi:Uncharacterised protein [Bordetella pertussis]|nr:Uncharacterised protein [Bordetella pertussis]CFN07612.1 Uncharacterised protein [Bordetella pertussis]CFO45667.1 Uncharacterised protein [Bordetella pertussis]CFO71382.1 Uncharacterised protein [Bordetella pertussis]CFP61805.1 Uncharacterised protein [Bordetella pertussis]
MACTMAAGLSRAVSMRLRSAVASPEVSPLAAASASSVELASISLGARLDQARAASRAPGRLPPASWNSSPRRARRGSPVSRASVTSVAAAVPYMPRWAASSAPTMR